VEKPIEKKKLRGRVRLRSPFLVGDIETLINSNKEHVAYVVGVMKVNPGERLPSKGSISWW
jgi:hypothetical protein